MQDYHQIASASVLRLIDSVASQIRSAGVSFRSIFSAMPTRCTTQIGSTFLYRDVGHLSRAGSRVIAERVSLADTLVRNAR